jgi:hypothetical protein
MDISESGAAIKILDDAYKTHIQKVRAYFKEISSHSPKEGIPNVDETVDSTLK